jgi:hypothetical protein
MFEFVKFFAKRWYQQRFITNMNNKGAVNASTNCVDAVSKGDFKLLKTLRENDEPWDWRTCATAAKYGEFEILAWLVQNGCPCDGWSIKCLMASKSGDYKTLLMLQKNDPFSAASLITSSRSLRPTVQREGPIK